MKSMRTSDKFLIDVFNQGCIFFPRFLYPSLLIFRWNYVYFKILWGGVINHGTFWLQISFKMFQKLQKFHHVVQNLSYFSYILPCFIKSAPWFGRCLSVKLEKYSPLYQTISDNIRRYLTIFDNLNNI